MLFSVDKTNQYVLLVVAQRVQRPHTGAVGAETPVGQHGGGAAVGAAGRSGTRTRWAAVEGAAGR